MIVSVGRIGCDDIIGSGLVHNPCCVCGESGNANASSGLPAQSYDSRDVCGGNDLLVLDGTSFHSQKQLLEIVQCALVKFLSPHPVLVKFSTGTCLT